MVVQRLDFRFSEYYETHEIEQLLETVTSRGATYHADAGPNYHLDIPKGLDFLPFYLTLSECESVAWVAAYARTVIIHNVSGIEG